VSIDGRIKTVKRVEGGLRIELVEYWHDYFAESGDHVVVRSIPGQPALTILDPVTWEPPIGLIAWGGAGDVEIVDGTGTRWYDRVGYTRLRERFKETP